MTTRIYSLLYFSRRVLLRLLQNTFEIWIRRIVLIIHKLHLWSPRHGSNVKCPLKMNRKRGITYTVEHYSTKKKREITPFLVSWINLWRPTRPSIRCPFHYRRLECKSKKSKNTWINRQIWPWSMEWSRAKANRVLPKKHTGHNKHPIPTT